MDESKTGKTDKKYFDGNDAAILSNYLQKKLVKKKYLLEYENHEIILSQGSPVDTCFYIDQGYVIAYETVNDKRRIYDAYDPGNIILANHASFDRPSAFTYESRAKTRLYYMSMDKLKRLLLNDNQFARAILAQASRDLLVYQDLLRKNTRHSASWLVSDFLLVMIPRYGKYEDGVLYSTQRFTQNMIADMLFINRITCHKELHKLEDMGLISVKYGYIGIRDMAALEAYRRDCGE